MTVYYANISDVENNTIEINPIRNSRSVHKLISARSPNGEVICVVSVSFFVLHI